MRKGFSLVGLLVGVAIMVVLYAILAQSLKGIGSGTSDSGKAVPVNKGRIADMFQLQQLMASLNTAGLGGGGDFPRPSELTGDASDDTTANVYSLLVAQRVIPAEMLISPLDNAIAEVCTDYDWSGWDPSSGVRWDTGFSADLDDYTNVSYAHLALYGERDENWSSRLMDSSFPIFSNRGPEDGIASRESLTCDADTGRWAGYVAFSDGHIDLINGVADATRHSADGHDAFFRIDDDRRHADAILGFTEMMRRGGPDLQWDCAI
ncbi:MAG: hypothetical protein QF471_03445, partial [Phycisphaerales bacterium]|nr:hypothetical protein [Phycisphaerales bacterium]